MQSADEQALIAVLRAAGVLGEADTAALTPLAGGVSCDVARADLPDGRTVVVKRSLPKLRVAADWRAPVRRARGEAAWLRLAARVDPRLAPDVLGESPTGDGFVMQWLDGAAHPVWKDELIAGRVDTAFAGAVGRDLARLHAATAAPGVLEAFDTGECFHELRTAPFLLHAAEQRADLAPDLRAVAQDLSTRRAALMHGDISPKNILVGPGGPVFLDAECVAPGDPAFDLTFCLTHLLLKSLWLAPSRAWLLDCARDLRAAYLAGVTWEPPQALDQRAVGLLGGLLLARIDGKSPAAYVTDPADRDFVRGNAAELLTARRRLPGLAAVFEVWEQALDRR